MQTNWAEENLQTIRTLMERSALYRRALAPIMFYCGGLGLAGGVAAWGLHLDSVRGFILFWAGAAVVAQVGAFLLVRRQALKDSEPFWSPPTRRVAQALFPPFFIGALLGAVFVSGGIRVPIQPVLVLAWSWLYGCALYSAGFFMPRGIRLLGWLFIAAGAGLLARLVWGDARSTPPPHLLMAGIFGGLHLAYGLYLYFTEKRANPS
jgi:hypothetical protein